MSDVEGALSYEDLKMHLRLKMREALGDAAPERKERCPWGLSIQEANAATVDAAIEHLVEVIWWSSDRTTNGRRFIANYAAESVISMMERNLAEGEA